MVRPVRVLHVIDGLAGGGSERWVFDIARLSNHDRVRHRVTTVHPDLGRFVFADGLRQLGAYGRPLDPAGRAPVATPSVAAGLVRLGREVPLAQWLRPVWQTGAVFPLGLYRLLAESRRFQPDVIHGHTFHGFVFALLLARIARRPLVHTVPSLIAQMEEAGFGWLPHFYRRYQRRVDAFFTAYPEELRRLGIRPDKIREIRGVVDRAAVDRVNADRRRYRGTIRQEIGAAADSAIALSVGRLHPSKGHDLGLSAIAAVARVVPELRWVVLGVGEERRVLEDRARLEGLGNRVHFLGYVRDVLPYYAAADVYLRTTRLEAENLSSYQAMAMGLPVVGFDTGAATELLGSVGHGVLVPNGDVARMGAALIDVLRSQDRGAALGERGRSYASAELGVDRTIAELTEAYEGFAGSRRYAGGA